jgi:hypothetical protein
LASDNSYGKGREREREFENGVLRRIFDSK